jgi:hypothetical protein
MCQREGSSITAQLSPRFWCQLHKRSYWNRTDNRLAREPGRFLSPITRCGQLCNETLTTPQLRLVSGWTRYPDLRDEPEHFLALNAVGTEVGSVKRTGTPDAGWDWALGLRHPDLTFPESITGSCATRGEMPYATFREAAQICCVLRNKADFYRAATAIEACARCMFRHEKARMSAPGLKAARDRTYWPIGTAEGSLVSFSCVAPTRGDIPQGPRPAPLARMVSAGA